MIRHYSRAAFVALALAALSVSALPLAYTHAAGGASLTLSPASSSEAAGATFTVSVMLDSGGGIGVNAADGQLSFDPTLLSVTSISKDNSIFNLWTSNPSFSNTAGTITYSGGSNNAYTGSAGDVIDINFKALAAGSANVKFTSATALAADGQGTNILGTMTGGTYTIGGAAAAASNASAQSGGSNSGNSQSSGANVGADSGGGSSETPFTVSIAISSPTDPDPGSWYSNDSPNFTWTLTPDVAGVNVAFDQDSGTIPKRTSVGLISSKQYTNVGEGTWYFHVRFEDALGDWSDTVNFPVNIDLTPPLPFTVTATPGAGISGRTELAFSATDTVSGVDHYVATFDGGASTTVALSDVQNGVYTAPPLLAGKHIVEIDAVDKAGNYTSENAEFMIAGVSMPDVTNYPSTVVEKTPIVIEGTADSGSNVTVDLQDASGKTAAEGNMITDETGHWIYAIGGGLPGGKYSVGVSMVTTEGATASSTDKIVIDVTLAPFLDRFGWILILLLFMTIGGLCGYGLYEKKLKALQLSLAQRETDEVRDKTKAVFEALREEMDEQINHMEGGAAQAQGEEKFEPEHVLDAVRNALVVSETTIQKEIEDVDKALHEE